MTNPTVSYGGYYGGDPRRFFPDEAACYPHELAAHRAACAAWDRGERPDPRTRACSYELGCERPYGVGTTVHEDIEEPEEEAPEVEEADDDEPAADGDDEPEKADELTEVTAGWLHANLDREP